MAENSKIEWCQHTFNPWVGCTKVSPACDHCYAETWAKRSGSVVWGGDRRRTSADNWRLPLKWNAQAERDGRRFRVFCASLADVFDNQVPSEWRADLFRLIADTPHLDWLLLSKRIGNACDMMNDTWYRDSSDSVLERMPLPNVWIGATVCNQEEADRDIPKLLEIPARIRFLSIEPMLGPIDLSYWIEPTLYCGSCGASYGLDEAIPDPTGHIHGADKCARCGAENCMGSWWGHEAIDEGSRGDLELEDWDHGFKLHWVICGGESGPKARPMHISWARDLMRQCKAAGVPFLMKQLGAQPRGWCAAQVHADEADREDGACDFYEGHELRDPCPGRCIAMVDKKGGDPAEWPEDLRVREYPHP